MKAEDLNYLNIGPRLKLSFALLIALIVGGNGLLIWQFHTARLQTDRLTGVSQQIIEVLRLQENLVLFHQRLGELAQSKDAKHLVEEAEPLRRNLLEQTQRTRAALAHLPPEIRVDPAFLPTLEAIEITLPSQIEAMVALAEAGDWEAVRLRLANELKPLETQTAVLVDSIDREVTAELAHAVANMTAVQSRILVLVPATAIATFFIAAFFGWAITRRIILLRSEERLGERTRIARELHDTLLQGMISASMQLHVVADQIPLESAARPMFDRILQLMAQVIEEGRNAIRGYRASPREMHDLETALSRVPQELEVKSRVDFRIIVEGRRQELRPTIHDEVYSIGREALVNAFRHSGANAIEVELEYSSSELRVLVRDDGCGIDTQLVQSGRDGHWGLSGMRERGERIGGRVKVTSGAGVGTQVELVVPAGIAFESYSTNAKSNWLAGFYRRHTGRTERGPKQPVG